MKGLLRLFETTSALMAVVSGLIGEPAGAAYSMCTAIYLRTIRKDLEK